MARQSVEFAFVAGATDTETGGQAEETLATRRPVVTRGFCLVIGGVSVVLAFAAAASAAARFHDSAIAAEGVFGVSAPPVAATALLRPGGRMDGVRCSNWNETSLGGAIPGLSEDQCVAKCSETPGCWYANFQHMQCGTQGNGMGTCYLVSKGCEVENNTCWHLIVPDPVAPPAFYMEGAITGCANWQNITVSVEIPCASKEQCGQKCLKDSQCDKFSFQSPAACEEGLLPLNGQGQGACFLFKAGCENKTDMCGDLYAPFQPGQFSAIGYVAESAAAGSSMIKVHSPFEATAGQAVTIIYSDGSSQTVYLIEDTGRRLAVASMNKTIVELELADAIEKALNEYDSVVPRADIATHVDVIDSPGEDDDNVTVITSMDGKSAVVTVTKRGQVHTYKMDSHSVFANDAEVVEYTDQGVVTLSPNKTTDGGNDSLRTFRSRKNGSWASATLLKDGRMAGVFQLPSGELLQVKPHAGNTPNKSHTILEVNNTGILMGGSLPDRRLGSTRILRRRLLDEDDEFEIAVDSDDTFGHISENVADRPNELHPRPAGASSTTWGGEAWHPGCYPGDDRLHELSLDLISDVRASQEQGSSLQDQILEAVNEASFVYEMQLNIVLKVKSLTMYSSASNAPWYAQGDCVPDFMNKYLMAMRNDSLNDASLRGKAALTHLFTGCGNGYGTIGIAFVEGLCHETKKFGVNQLNGRVNEWLTFAHELGHNLGAHHSFEEGMKTTGGIMDYGDGELSGVYQFNSKYRKAEMCKHISENILRCGSHFVPAPPSHCTSCNWTLATAVPPE